MLLKSTIALYLHRQGKVGTICQQNSSVQITAQSREKVSLVSGFILPRFGSLLSLFICSFLLLTALTGVLIVVSLLRSTTILGISFFALGGMISFFLMFTILRLYHIMTLPLHHSLMKFKD
jgi:hypothetical protein